MTECITPAQTPRRNVFFTVNLAQRGSDLLTREIAALREAVRKPKQIVPLQSTRGFSCPIIFRRSGPCPKRCRLFHALEHHQSPFSRSMPHIDLLNSLIARREHLHLAAALLGAPHPVRPRKDRRHPLLLDQPCQTRACHRSRRLALFIISPRCPVGCAFIAHRQQGKCKPMRASINALRAHASGLEMRHIKVQTNLRQTANSPK